MAKRSNINFDHVIADLKAIAHDMAKGSRKSWGALTSHYSRIAILSITFLIVITGSAIAIDMGMTTMKANQRNISNPESLMNSKNTGTTILDRNGEVLFQGYGAVTRHNIPLNEMPDSLKNATLATEDPDFYQHGGFSWKGTTRAIIADLRHTGMVQGGSTITQQLVKNTLLTNEKSFTRKYKEAVLAVDMERRYSKDQILQMYLNTIYYGQGAYGVESAAQTYFNKPAKELTLEESALLAGLAQSPSRYDPNVDKQAAKDRRDYVLSRMQEEGYITESIANQTANKPVVAGMRKITIKAPHFVFFVLDELRRKYGPDIVEKGGITVTTTLDYKKQEAAEQIVKAQVEKLASRNATNSGLVAVTPNNGDIISMVGSVDYNKPGYGAVNVTLAQLQPGSSFKPIAYATAFTKGWNGATKVDDKPMRVPQYDGTVYEPKNYDGKFRGQMTLRRALANSFNIPAIEVLKYAGLPDTITMAHSLGIQAPSLTQPDRYGLSLVLGGGEVRPLDMAGVYSTFANYGTTVTPRAIKQVKDKYGDEITKPAPNTSKQVIDPRVTYMVTNILSDNKTREEMFGTNSPLKLSRPAAVKTGTTNDYRDNWAVGYTPDIVTAVWVGNNDHSPMVNVDGVTGAAPIWKDYMEMAHAGMPIKEFPVPPGVVFAKVCASDGGLVDQNDPNGVTEVFLAESQETRRCGSGSDSQSKPQPIIEARAEAPVEQVQQAQAPIQPVDEPGRGGGGGNIPPQPEPPQAPQAPNKKTNPAAP
mgnify:FL=1